MFNMNFCQWLDLNRGPVESEATALPTEPQPLPILTEILSTFDSWEWWWCQLFGFERERKKGHCCHDVDVDLKTVTSSRHRKIKLGKFKTHQLESCTLSFLSLSSLSSLFLSVDLFLVESWSSLLQGDEQLDWPNSETNIEFGGRGGGQVVSVLAFYSNDPSSNPADASSFFCKNCIWKERK